MLLLLVFDHEGALGLRDVASGVLVLEDAAHGGDGRAASGRLGLILILMLILLICEIFEDHRFLWPLTRISI